MGKYIVISVVSLAFLTSLAATSNLAFKLAGPGLRPEITLPVRYFFIRAFDESGSLVPLEADKLDVSVSCRHRSNKIQREDGSLIFRFKLFETCKLTLGVFYDGKLVDKISGRAETESCSCPKPSWLGHCPPGLPEQIASDLEPFPKINWRLIRPKLLDTFNNPESTSFCNYVVKDNSVFRKCYGKYTGFSMFMDAILLSLSRIWEIPDIEFFINLGDWPLIRGELFPMFSWCGNVKAKDIVLPTYDLTESSIENMGRVSLDMLSVQKANIPWNQKINKAFWRGRDSRRERLDLVELARRHPNLFNATITNYFFFRDEIPKYGPPGAMISFHDFFDYKLQVSIDGTVAAYRVPYLLAGDSALLKQDSPYYEHFYRDLEPMVHFVPFKRDLSDLLERVEWALKNTDKVRQISRNGRKFAEENLLPHDVYCYHAKLFLEFSQRLEEEVEVQPDMEKVQQVKCRCETRDEL